MQNALGNGVTGRDALADAAQTEDGFRVWVLLDSCGDLVAGLNGVFRLRAARAAFEKLMPHGRKPAYPRFAVVCKRREGNSRHAARRDAFDHRVTHFNFRDGVGLAAAFTK